MEYAVASGTGSQVMVTIPAPALALTDDGGATGATAF
jgi:hypothetical protein